MARVLIGDFGAIVRLGLWDLFEDGGDVVMEETSAVSLVDRLVDTAPDAVVLDLDLHVTTELAGSIAMRFPAVTVIACSSAEPSMRIYPPFHHGESYVVACTPAELMSAVRGRSQGHEEQP